MFDYGKVRSAVKPDPVLIDEYSVWVHTDIQKVDEPGTDETPGFSGYEYNMQQYGKDEFILSQAAKNDELSAEITSLELAMCEMYEAEL